MLPVIFQNQGFTIYSYGLLNFLGYAVGLLLFILTIRGSWPETEQLASKPIQVIGLVGATTVLVTLFGILAALAGVIFWGIWMWWLKRNNLLFVVLWLFCAIMLLGTVAHKINATFQLSEDLLFPRLVTFVAFVGLPWIFYRRLDPLRSFDAAIPAALIGLAICKLGCFLAGCCSGAPCGYVWCLSFPAGSLAAFHHRELGLINIGSSSLPVHPVQLYTALLYGIAGFIGLWMARKKNLAKGQLACLCLAVGLGMSLLLQLWTASENRYAAVLQTLLILSIGVLIALGILVRFLTHKVESDGQRIKIIN